MLISAIAISELRAYLNERDWLLQPAPEINMGDKSPKAKQRDKKQKDAAKTVTNQKKQERQQSKAAVEKKK